MKVKRLLLLLLLISLGILLVACAPKPIYHTVKFDSNGGTVQQNIAIESGNLLSKPKDPEWVGYTFLGWYDGDTLWDFENNAVTSDITLKAKWERIIYTVTFNSDGGTNTHGQAIGLGDCASKPKDPIKDGHVFKGWYLENTAWDFEKMVVTSDIILTAKWERATCTVTYDSDGGNKIDPHAVLYGESATAPIPPTKKNSKFAGWYFGDIPWDFEKNKITSDITLMAKWEPVPTHTVKFMYSETDDVVYSTRYIADGEKLIPPAPPTRDRWVFLGWYLGEVEFDFENTVIKGPLTLTAKWELLKGYTIRFNTDGGPEVNDQFVLEGGLIVPPNPTRPYHSLQCWMYNGEEWDFDVPPTSDMELIAVWNVDLPMHDF